MSGSLHGFRWSGDFRWTQTRSFASDEESSRTIGNDGSESDWSRPTAYAGGSESAVQEVLSVEILRRSINGSP